MQYRLLVISVLALILGLSLGCEGKKVTGLKLTPPGPYKFERRVESPQIKVSALDQDGRPMPLLKMQPIFETSDSSVVTVDKNGKLAAKGSGKAQISVRLKNVTKKVDAIVSLAEVIEFTEESTTKMRLSDKPGKVVVVVKDRNGNVLTGRNLKLKTNDYCVKVRQNGTVFPASLGRCDVIATVDGATNAHTITVSE